MKKRTPVREINEAITKWFLKCSLDKKKSSWLFKQVLHDLNKFTGTLVLHRTFL